MGILTFTCLQAAIFWVRVELIKNPNRWAKILCGLMAALLVVLAIDYALDNLVIKFLTIHLIIVASSSLTLLGGLWILGQEIYIYFKDGIWGPMTIYGALEKINGLHLFDGWPEIQEMSKSIYVSLSLIFGSLVIIIIHLFFARRIKNDSK